MEEPDKSEFMERSDGAGAPTDRFAPASNGPAQKRSDSPKSTGASASFLKELYIK